MKPTWHGFVGFILTGKDGSYCGHVGLAYPCSSQQEGWSKAIDWLRNFDPSRFNFLVRTFDIQVRYF